MPVFMGFLAYLIVKFKAFDIKLIGAQALVYGLVILIGSQFFFIQNNTNRILTGITLALAVGFGIFLIRSVKNEVKRKEELQTMTEKLAVANDQLRKLDNAKSEFISIASHQLRTPLTSIKGYASLILEGTYGTVDPKIIDPINKMYASNERLIQLVEELLNISRIESGRMEFIFEKKKVEFMIKELSDTFSILAKEKKLYLHIQLPKEPLPEIEVDGSKVREVISNLIDNSIKYTRRGGVTIKAEIWKGPSLDKNIPEADRVRIIISDTGIGIPETELPYLFAKFSRGKDTQRLHANGTGLGLYVGKNIIEAHHGRIWAESEGADKGARFIIELPIEQPKA
jgi:signal transduction histidine kinase